MADNILSAWLRKAVEAGIFERRPYDERWITSSGNYISRQSSERLVDAGCAGLFDRIRLPILRGLCRCLCSSCRPGTAPRTGQECPRVLWPVGAHKAFQRLAGGAGQRGQECVSWC